jgi:hypothetical protein
MIKTLLHMFKKGNPRLDNRFVGDIKPLVSEPRPHGLKTIPQPVFFTLNNKTYMEIT